MSGRKVVSWETEIKVTPPGPSPSLLGLRGMGPSSLTGRSKPRRDDHTDLVVEGE